MKKVVKMIVFLSGLFFLAGCDQSSGSEIKEPVDTSLITIYCTVEPKFKNITGGSAVYMAYCQISPPAGVKHNNVTVRVNNTVLPKSTHSDNYYQSEDVGTFSTGDKILFSINDASLGKISLTGVVPPMLSDFTVFPEMPASGTANTKSTYEISWTADPAADGYSYMSYRYSSSTTIAGVGIGDTTKSSPQFMNTGSSDSTPYSWIGLILNSQNTQGIPDFDSNSKFRVQGTNSIRKTNLEK